MVALARDRNTPRRIGEIAAYAVAANAKIYAGSLVCLNATGYAVAAADAAGLRFVGVAKEYADNTGGADGDRVIQVWETGELQFAAAGMARTDVGLPVFVSDDQTVAKAGGVNAVGCGIITEFVSATAIWIRISAASRRTGGAQADVAAANAAAAAGANPTKAEFDALVTLANEEKTVLNGLLAKLRAAGLIAS